MAVFVGRSGELAELGARLERAVAGSGSVVFVTGEAGAGKSSLIQQFFLEATLRTPETRIISGGCSEQFGAGEPYQPFVEAFRGLVQESDQPESKRGIRDLAGELAPFWLQAIPLAGGLIAATAATARELKTVGGGGTATAAPPSEEALFFQYTELLFAVAAEHPVILYIDDLHWADAASVSLLGQIGRRVADERVLVIGSYRAADVEIASHPIKKARLELERYGIAKMLPLEPLDSSALAAFVNEELDAPASPELVQWLEERAGTNPLFFGELLRWLVDQGHARLQHEEWYLATLPQEIEIPRSAASAIEARISRLDPEVYRVLEYASVQGAEFDSVTLSRLLDMDELELEEMLEPLARVHQLIRLHDTRELPDGEVASVYQFGHSLVQEALHKRLVGKRRILLHRKVAQLLEATHGPNTDAVAHRLVVHYDEGRVPTLAFSYALRAADRAIRVFAHWNALEILARARRNAQGEEQRLEVLDRLGESNGALGRFAEALEAFTEALDLSEARSDAARALRIRRKFVVLEQHHGGRTPASLAEELTSLERTARELGEKAELCHILWHFRAFPDASLRRGVERAGEALDLAEDLGDEELVARAHYEVGTALMFAGQGELAIPEYEKARSLYDQLGNRDRIGACENGLGNTCLLLGDFRAAAGHYDAAAKIFRAVQDPVSTLAVRNNLGILRIRLGEWQAAEETLCEALRIAERLDAARRALHPIQNLAELFQSKGDAAAARERWEQLLERATSVGYWNYEIVARCGLGLLHLDAQEIAAARQELAAAEALLGRADSGSWSENHEAVYMLAARIRAADGDLAGAARLLEEAEVAVAGQDQYIWATFRLMRGELGGPDGAALISDALSTFEKLGARPMQERAVALLSACQGGV